MFNDANLLWLIPGFPLLGAVLAALMGWNRKLGHLTHLPAVLGSALSFGVTIIAWMGMPETTHLVESGGFTWFSVPPLDVSLKLVLDPLSVVMLLVITFIGTWIVVFSIGYIHDEGYSRYFAIVSLFIFSMTLLVLASNFLGLVAGWEGVGVCSYLLVGYWYKKPSAAAAARKAFLVTRLGDAAMLLGIFLLWHIAGLSGSKTQTLEFSAINARADVFSASSHGLLMVACLLLFCGAAGKSAQVPLYVWLPDAMEGPTPVSALIHAATMVTAGVYLLARNAVLFSHVPEVQAVIATLGAVTAVVAAFIALTQNDLKRVLAYSTVSQLGYMFLALGTGGVNGVLPVVAMTAAIFHLFTHAFFKAVLFLSSGSVMHAMGDVIDMRKFSGLRKVLPVTHLTFLAGAAALAGLPLLSGFWSKDQILECVEEAAHGPYQKWLYSLLFWTALFTAFLTAFYTFRAYYKTFWGEKKIPPEAGEHAHESPAVMTIPLIVLAIGALGAGALAEPVLHWFGQFLALTPAMSPFFDQPEPAHHAINWRLIGLSVGAAFAGVLLAWWCYCRKATTPEAESRRMPGYYLSLNRLYVDEIYVAFLVRPLEWFASFCRAVEGLVYDLVRTIAALPAVVASGLRPLQNGLVQFYGISMIMGVAAFLFYLILWTGR
jgi:proton-translocating NADH-quinone oxidoreductase chain L